ncbi:MAG: 23S rRNA (adenine(2503)-C(2))-methyltransferase RlmN [Clostridiales bacterium]|nr:23S rRNA (adenine(2503)-C(2))-methyltransferase RlmN [Clostridiales bacterium]
MGTDMGTVLLSETREPSPCLKDRDGGRCIEKDKIWIKTRMQSGGSRQLVKEHEKKKKVLQDLSKEELLEFVLSIGMPKFRAGQIFRWLGRGVSSIDDMTDLSLISRSLIKEKSMLCTVEIFKKFTSAIDGTIKYLFSFDDGNIIEGVFMEYKHGYSVCISSQVGCRMGCVFCASTPGGWVRNLTAGEMLGQITAIMKDTGKKPGSIVIMGIGEPFDNYSQVISFIKTAHDPEYFDIGYRHFTISTCGLVPGILKLANENIPINLSISLHSPEDVQRAEMMPIARTWSIDKTIEACKIYTEATGRRVTFEYALIASANDSTDNANKLAKRLSGVLCHVNLIPLNKVEGTTFRQSDRDSMQTFLTILESRGIPATVRRELGSDVAAACGQLRRSSKAPSGENDSGIHLT